jgi:hypothetical protein
MKRSMITLLLGFCASTAFACPVEYPNCALSFNGLAPEGLVVSDTRSTSTRFTCPHTEPHCTVTVNGINPQGLVTTNDDKAVLDKMPARTALKYLGTQSLVDGLNLPEK